MADVVDRWLAAGDAALIAEKALRPREHPRNKNFALVVGLGQAECFYLRAAAGDEWILKKFRPGRQLDYEYISAIRAILPNMEGFESGFNRQVLRRGSLSHGGHYSKGLSEWLENTVLMPRVAASEWGQCADGLRLGVSTWTLEQRLTLCNSLASLIDVLERGRLSHRDLSWGNVMVDSQLNAHVIDWDSLYAPQLTMPRATPYGTDGYTAPQVWAKGSPNPAETWRESSDRFALSVLIAEFLCISQGSPLYHDAGCFNQDDINRRSGPSIAFVLKELSKLFPRSIPLLEQALVARTFDAMPSPSDWLAVCRLSQRRVPRLAEVPDPTAELADFLLRRQQRAQLLPSLPEEPDWTNVPGYVKSIQRRIPSLADFDEASPAGSVQPDQCSTRPPSAPKIK